MRQSLVWGLVGLLGLASFAMDLARPEIGSGAVTRAEFEQEVALRRALDMGTAVSELLALAAEHVGAEIVSVHHVSFSPSAGRSFVFGLTADGRAAQVNVLDGQVEATASWVDVIGEGGAWGFPTSVDALPLAVWQSVPSRALDEAERRTGVPRDDWQLQGWSMGANESFEGDAADLLINVMLAVPYGQTLSLRYDGGGQLVEVPR